MKYHIKNKISRREVRKNAKKILPLGLVSKNSQKIMEDKLNAQAIRVGDGQRRVEENIRDVQDFQGAKDVVD